MSARKPISPISMKSATRGERLTGINSQGKQLQATITWKIRNMPRRTTPTPSRRQDTRSLSIVGERAFQNRARSAPRREGWSFLRRALPPDGAGYSEPPP
jgi:hypothetical protein